MQRRRDRFFGETPAASLREPISFVMGVGVRPGIEANASTRIVGYGLQVDERWADSAFLPGAPTLFAQGLFNAAGLRNRKILSLGPVLGVTRMFMSMTTLAGNRMKCKKVMGTGELNEQTDARCERHITAGLAGRELR